MADAFLAIADIANDHFMQERMNAAVTQQHHLDNDLVFPPDPLAWVMNNRYVWAASPSWGEKWHSAFVSHPDDDNYEPGKDSSVITDGDILATVQAMGSPG